MIRARRRPDSADPLPHLSDRGLQLLLVFVFCLQCLSWWRLEGYQLADSVEYMERALMFARGVESVESRAIRSFAFPALLVPVFYVWDLLGIEDARPVVWIIRLVQMGLGLALVVVCARIGARLAGRRAGLVAGFLVGVNPIFLQYSVSPVSGIAAALFVALGLDALLDRGSWRRSFVGGAWLGLAFLVAYKTILIVVPITLLLLLRDRWRHRGPWVAATAGIALAVVLQVGLDKLSYGRWGASLSQYMLENVGYGSARLLHDAGFDAPARRIYALTREAQGLDQPSPEAVGSEPTDLHPGDFYVSHLDRMLVWPVLLVGVLGILCSCKRPTWKAWILLLVFLANVYVMSKKSSKDFRLWLPLLPMIAPICAIGWTALFGSEGEALWRRALSVLLLVGACTLGLRSLFELDTRRFGVYWEAMDVIADEVGDTRPYRAARKWEQPRWRVAAAYHFAMFLRDPPNVELVKLPWNLDEWRFYSPEQRQRDIETIRGLDWFVAHLPALELDPELMKAFNEEFEVHSAMFDRDMQRELGPVFILKRRTGTSWSRTFFGVDEGMDPEKWSASQGLRGRRVDFLAQDGSGERLVFLGFQVEEIGPHGHAWISYHWYTPTGISADLTIIDRITSEDGHDSWQNDHRGAHGVLPTSEWGAGAIVRESYLLIAAAEPFGEDGLRHWIGGSYRRGDLIPVHLWLKLAEYDADGVESPARFLAARPGDDAPLHELAALETPDGWRFSPDGLVRVGGFFLSTHPGARVRDDGGPLE